MALFETIFGSSVQLSLQDRKNFNSPKEEEGGLWFRNYYLFCLRRAALQGQEKQSDESLPFVTFNTPTQKRTMF